MSNYENRAYELLNGMIDKGIEKYVVIQLLIMCINPYNGLECENVNYNLLTFYSGIDPILRIVDEAHITLGRQGTKKEREDSAIILIKKAIDIVLQNDVALSLDCIRARSNR